MLGFPGGAIVKNPPANPSDAGDTVRTLSQESPLQKEMATHSCILAWEIPWTEEPDGLHSPWGRKELDTTEQQQQLGNGDTLRTTNTKVQEKEVVGTVVVWGWMMEGP